MSAVHLGGSNSRFSVLDLADEVNRNLHAEL